VLSNVSEQDAGIAAGVVSTMQQVRGALGVAIVGLIFFSAVAAANERGMDGYGRLYHRVLVGAPLQHGGCRSHELLICAAAAETGAAGVIGRRQSSDRAFRR
jgi:hypothetical protein